MKSIYYLAGLAVLALASCSENSEFESNPITAQAAKGTPVSFGTYQAQSTRAGATGSITTEVLKKADYGFGVFAYSTGTADYSTSATPNFMWNQKVTYNTSGATDETGATPDWIYSPVKFWPNANETADDANAVGDPTSSKISFFAYAPYIGDNADGTMSAPGTSGIIEMSGNGDAGNPTVTYALAADGKQVDLLWGTAEAGKTYETVTGTDVTVAKVSDDALAATNINLVKLTTGQKIKFNFKHALAKIGGGLQVTDDTTDPVTKETTNHGLQVQLDIDQDGNITGGTKPTTTKVTVKTIKIVNDAASTNTDQNGDNVVDEKDYIYSQGTLDLATGLWTVDNTKKTDIKHVITSDATTGDDATASNATLNEEIAEPAGVAAWADLTKGGVTTDPQNVYADEANPLVFIPNTTPAFKISVTYIVRTEDAHLANGYSEAEQTITKKVSFPTIELNKRYNLIMHLGLTSIKFDATVENWETASDPDGDDDNDGTKNSEDPDYTGVNQVVNLPINVAD